MRGVAYELLLRLEGLLIAVEGLFSGHIELLELSDVGRVVQRRVLGSYPEAVQPAQETVERPHVAVEDQNSHQYDCQQQGKIQNHYPDQGGLHELLLVYSRGIGLEEVVVVTVRTEYRGKHPGGLPAYGRKLLVVEIITYGGMVMGELLPDRDDVVDDVGSYVGG